MEPISRVGFIGLGNMGFPMAGRLADAGFKLTIYDINQIVSENFVKRHAGKSAASASEVGLNAQVVITMLPDGQAVRRVVLGDQAKAKQGLLDSMPGGAVLIDMSSSAPTGTLYLGQQMADKNITLLDAPVSGGVSKAKDGSLAIMVGGDQETIRHCMPLLEVMGARIFETGPLGSGHSMKVLNNLVSAAGLIAAAEALLIGTRFGLTPDVMIDVLNASTGRNNSTENKFKQFVLSRAFNSGFSLALMVKDLTTALDLAHESGVPATFGETCLELWLAALSKLEKNADHTAVVRWFEENSGIELKRSEVSN